MRSHTTRAALAGLALLGALSLLAPPARAQGTPPAGAEATAEKPLGVVKLDIEETLDGKPNRNTPTILNIRKKLRDLGFVVWTEKPLYADEHAKKQREKEAAKTAPGAPSGTAAPGAPASEEQKPLPDLVIQGKVVVKLDRTSTFFGGNVAFMYAGTADLTVTGKDGKTLAAVAEKDEWGKTKEDAAREDEIRRMRAFATLAVLRCEPVQARLTEKGKSRVSEYAAEVEKNYARKQEGEGGAPAPGGPAPEAGASAGTGEEKKQ